MEVMEKLSLIVAGVIIGAMLLWGVVLGLLGERTMKECRDQDCVDGKRSQDEEGPILGPLLIAACVSCVIIFMLTLKGCMQF